MSIGSADRTEGGLRCVSPMNGMATIFIADGNAMMRKLMKGLIESHEGWEVCGEAVDGPEAVKKVFELKPDLVILDLAMPELNGLLAAREIAKTCPAMPIVLHTFHDFPEMVSEAKKYGVSEVVGKGEGGDRLLDVVEALLELRPDGLAAMLEELPLRISGNGANSLAEGEESAGVEETRNARKLN